MADVVVTVSIDGKQAYVHGAGNAPDAHAFVAGALQAASDHFKSVVASRPPQLQQIAPGTFAPKDTSL